MAVRMCYARAGEEEETVGQVRVAGVREEGRCLAARQEVAAVAATQAEEARDLRFHQDQVSTGSSLCGLQNSNCSPGNTSASGYVSRDGYGGYTSGAGGNGEVYITYP